MCVGLCSPLWSYLHAQLQITQNIQTLCPLLEWRSQSRSRYINKNNFSNKLITMCECYRKEAGWGFKALLWDCGYDPWPRQEWLKPGSACRLQQPVRRGNWCSREQMNVSFVYWRFLTFRLNVIMRAEALRKYSMISSVMLMLPVWDCSHTHGSKVSFHARISRLACLSMETAWHNLEAVTLAIWIPVHTHTHMTHRLFISWQMHSLY